MRRSRLQRGTTSIVLAASLVGGVVAIAAASAGTAGAVTTAATVAVTSSANPSSYGQTVTLRAVVSDPGTPRTQLTGTMTFADGTTALATKTVTSGSAAYSTRLLTAGDHPITATYNPTGGGAFTSSPLVQTVNLGASTLALTTTRPVSYNGQAGNVTATVKPVAPAFGIPTGTVDFLVDGSWYWTSTLDANGKATLAYSDLAAGTYAITATYSGDTNFNGSSSVAALTQIILPNAPTAGVTFTPSTVVVGGVSKLVVTATNNGPIAMPNVAMGVLLPSLPATIVSLPPGTGCRRALRNLLYCGVSLPRGATRSIVLNVTGAVAGTYATSSYARNIDTGDETGAVASLIVQ